MERRKERRGGGGEWEERKGKERKGRKRRRKGKEERGEGREERRLDSCSFQHCQQPHWVLALEDTLMLPLFGISASNTARHPISSFSVAPGICSSVGWLSAYQHKYQGIKFNTITLKTTTKHPESLAQWFSTCGLQPCGGGGR